MKRILVPIDFSTPSLAALRQAVHYTQTVGGELLLLHVVEGEPLRWYAVDGLQEPPSARLDPTAAGLELIFERVRAAPKRVVFAEGEEEKTIRAAVLFKESGYGTPVLVGREERIKATMSAIGLTLSEGLEIHNARL